MERHQLFMEANYQSNFFGDIDEINTLKYIAGYICLYITPSNNSHKSTRKELKTALLYITSHIAKLGVFVSSLVQYISLLIDEVISQYEKMEEFMWCHNLLNLKNLFDRHYSEELAESV